MKISLIAAMGQNCVIGNNNQLPWHLPADLQYFKKITLGKPIIMGRNTYESIGKPLPGRRNIVITSQLHFQADGCDVVHSLEEAIALCNDVEEIMIIGGANLYEQSMQHATHLYITLIHDEFDGDKFFPEYSLDVWQEESCEKHSADDKNLHDYSFLVFVRKVYTHRT